ncbi:hypothetical protein [Stutzerimonas stutzeri]|uniref:hypothetical protein n=1 Tax=Stutzerimonas stutzeri TaxID=316 RepID=UPI001F2915AA|nr:hypothetical protein [Stutzerimonas stutzeri]
MKKYLVSGVGVSNTGVGRLLRNLESEANSRGYQIISKRNRSIREMYREGRCIGAFWELLLRVITSLMFSLRLRVIKDSKVIFIHPQTAGYKNLFRLSSQNQVYLYVMDNSFFCIRSYNLHPLLEVECLNCLGDPSKALPECTAYPVEISQALSKSYLYELRSLSSKIIFLAQNENQKQLIRRHFGEKTRVVVVGLDTGETGDPRVSDTALKSKGHKYDMVFHGAANLAKGVRFFIELAEYLSEFSAFVPAHRRDCERIMGRAITATNIDFVPCSWETGLKQAVLNSKLVFNPSLWSAPIEGALLKSLHYAKKVLVVESKFGYESEISAAHLVRIPRDIPSAAEAVRSELNTLSLEPCRYVHWRPSQKMDIFEAVESN